MKIELRKLTTNQKLSEETLCFSATLYIDGVKTADYANRGHGGGDEVHVFNKEKHAAFVAHCKSLPPIPSCVKGGDDLEMDEELFIAELIEKMQQSKRLKRVCKGKTLVRVDGDKQDSWRIFAEEFTPAVREKITHAFGVKFPGKAIEFLNDHIID